MSGALALLSRVSRVASGLPWSPPFPHQNSANPNATLSANAKRQRSYESSEVGTSNAVSVPPFVVDVQRPNFQLSLFCYNSVLQRRWVMASQMDGY